MEINGVASAKAVFDQIVDRLDLIYLYIQCRGARLDQVNCMTCGIVGDRPTPLRNSSSAGFCEGAGQRAQGKSCEGGKRSFLPILAYTRTGPSRSCAPCRPVARPVWWT